MIQLLALVPAAADPACKALSGGHAGQTMTRLYTVALTSCSQNARRFNCIRCKKTLTPQNAYINTYTHACIRTYIHTHAYLLVLRTYIHTYVARAYAHRPTIHTYIHTYMHTYIHTYMHTYIYTYIHTYICLHQYTYLLVSGRLKKFEIIW